MATPRPPEIDATPVSVLVTKFIGWLAAAAVLIMALAMARLGFTVMGVTNDLQRVSRTAFRGIDADADTGGIQSASSPGSGSSRYNAEARREALRRLSASPREAAAAARQITIIGLSFNAAASPGAHDLVLDMSRTSGNAVVLLAEGPTSWRVKPPRQGPSRALIGLEGEFAPTFDGLAPGTIAGFHLADAGASDVAAPVDPFDADIRTRQLFCRAVDQWQSFYKLKRASVEYVLFENAHKVRFDGHQWDSDGRRRATLDHADLMQACGR